MSESYELVKRLYDNPKGDPFEMTEGQIEIFDAIFKRQEPRNHLMTYTQYGKTEIVSMAVLTRASTFPEKWAIVAPDMKRAKIMMGDIIKHIFENDYTKQRFKIKPSESEERILRERSKRRLTFRVDDGISEIFILSAQSKYKGEDAGNALMGFGSPNLIEDEAALIPNKIHSKAMRMLGGHPDNFLFKIGNPFKRNHFLDSDNDPRYNTIVVDWHQGVEEGRTSRDFIAEMQDQPFFGILYECQFPEEEAMDEQGWMPLVTESEVEQAMQGGSHFGEARLGVDPADTGPDNSVVIKRSHGYAEVLFKSPEPDPMDLSGIIIKKSDDVDKIYIDGVGVGAGVVSRVKEVNRQQRMELMITNVNANQKTPDRKFKNKKAEMFWRIRQWLKEGGKLSEDDEWFQLCDIKYRTDSRGKVEIQPKKKLLKEGITSPDVADALATTFFDTEKPRDISAKERRFIKKMQEQKKKSGSGYNMKMT